MFTCYKNAKWRLPADLDNTLRYTACDKGWLDTSSMMDIKLTPEGENFVEFDLPQKSKDSKK